MSAPYADLFNFAGVQRDAGADPLHSDSSAVQALIDAGHVTREDRWYSNEGGDGRYVQDNVDWAAPGLPTVGPENSKYGNWVPVGDASRELLRPEMVYNDPNYGLLTPSFNQKSNIGDWQDLIGPLVLGAVTAGAGWAAGAGTLGLEAGAGAGAGFGGAGADALAWSAASSTPSWLNSGLSAARQIGGGNPTVSGLIGSALPHLGEFGIPTSITQGLSLANTAYGATNTKGLPAVNSEQNYVPGLYGNMGSMAQGASDGSERVATSIAPGAYANSYNSITS